MPQEQPDGADYSDIILAYDQLYWLDKYVGDYLYLDRAKTSTANRLREMSVSGMEFMHEGNIPLQNAVDILERGRDEMKTKIQQIIRDDSPLFAWEDNVTGLGKFSVALLTGCYATAYLTEPYEIPSVRSAWAYQGLHVEDGQAPQYRVGENAGFCRQTRARIIHRVAAPAIRFQNYYRWHAYLREKAKKDDSPREAGENWTEEDIHWYNHYYENAVGKKWPDASKAHINAHALRVTAKEIVKDWWRVMHGQEPHA